MTNYRQGFSRTDKVRKAMMREVSDIIARDVRAPELDNLVISVTDVDLSPDLQHAKIFISVMGSEAIREIVLETLLAYQPKIRQAIGQRIRLRYTPHIEFAYDDSLERGSRVTQLLEQIAKESDD